MEEMLAAIREAIHEHAAQARDVSGAGDAGVDDAGARQVVEDAAPNEGARMREMPPVDTKPAPAEVRDGGGFDSDVIPAPVALAGDSAFRAEAVDLDVEDDGIEWADGPDQGEGVTVETAATVAQPALTEPAPEEGDAGLRERPVAQPEAPFSAQVVPLTTRQGATKREAMPSSAAAPAAASSSMTSATAPATMGALALQNASAEPAPVVRLSAPVRGRVQQALSRLQARERLQELHAMPEGEAALREMLQDMLRPMLEEWAREHLPQLVEERVRNTVAAELARLSSGEDDR